MIGARPLEMRRPLKQTDAMLCAGQPPVRKDACTRGFMTRVIVPPSGTGGGRTMREEQNDDPL